jgi:hypothetical protein
LLRGNEKQDTGLEVRKTKKKKRRKKRRRTTRRRRRKRRRMRRPQKQAMVWEREAVRCWRRQSGERETVYAGLRRARCGCC